MPSSGERLLSIGEFSRLSRISVRMLRHYDEHGVLAPTATDPWSGYRYYAADLLRTAAWIRELRDVGLKVAELAACRPLLDDPGALAAVLKEQRRVLEAEASTVSSRIWRVDHLVTMLEGSPMSTESVTTVTERVLPARTVASVRGTIPGYQAEGQLWERLMAAAPPAGARFSESGLAIAVFHDEDVVETDADVEVQVDVVAPFAGTDQVRCVDVPEQRVAVGRLYGSYDGYSAVAEALGRWVAENGRQVTGPMFNIYVVSPMQNPDPAAWVTDVCIPVAPAPGPAE